jgi:predicted enzyme related to lactoylglutathione lyase
MTDVEPRPKRFHRDERNEMNLNSIMIGSQDAPRLAAYYTKLFGKPNFESEGFSGWQIGSGFLTLGPHDGVTGKSEQPGRVMWNIETPDVKGEFDRMRDAGAVVVQEPYTPEGVSDGWIATLSDPDGNYFQLMSPMEEPS